LGDVPDDTGLLTRTQAVADAYLAEQDAELTGICRGSYALTVDPSLVSRIRSLGYRSSFYYYCWDIYLPYSLTAQSGPTYVVVVQLSDSLPGHSHDVDKFHVIRAMVIDSDNKTVARWEAIEPTARPTRAGHE